MLKAIGIEREAVVARRAGCVREAEEQTAADDVEAPSSAFVPAVDTPSSPPMAVEASVAFGKENGEHRR